MSIPHALDTRRTAPASPRVDAAPRDPWWQPLVGDRLGIVRRIVNEPVPAHFPRSFRLVSAVLADSTRWSSWVVDSCGAGYSIADQPHPVAAAVGEALERYCGNIVASTHRGSYAELAAADRRAIDPDSLALFSDEQHAAPGFPFARFTRDLVVDWATGHDLASGDPVLVPAALVWPSYPAVTADHGHGVTNPVYQPGLAAGTDLTHAVLSGLLEIVERDAMVLTWHDGRELAPVAVPTWLDRLASGPSDTLATRFFAFPNPFDVAVVGALVRDRRSGYLTLGLAARLHLRAGLLKALAEALQLHRFVADLDDPRGAYTSRVGATSPIKAWRGDRRYLDDYADDLSDATDDGCNLQLYLDPRMQQRFDRALAQAATAPPVDATNLAARTTDDHAADAASAGRRLAERIKAVTSVAPAVVDLTTDDVVDAGVRARVVRVVAPGAYANSSVAYPFLGGERRRVDVSSSRYRSLPLPH